MEARAASIICKSDVYIWRNGFKYQVREDIKVFVYLLINIADHDTRDELLFCPICRIIPAWEENVEKGLEAIPTDIERGFLHVDGSKFISDLATCLCQV